MSQERKERDTLIPDQDAPVPPPFRPEAGTGRRSAVVVSSFRYDSASRLLAQLPEALPESGLFLREVPVLDSRLPSSLFQSGVHGDTGVSHPGGGAEPAKLELPPLGTIIDKYRLEEVIGIGAFGVVFRATHLLLKTTVAIKLLRRDVMLRRPDLARRLCDEAGLAARVGHPNVVRVIDVTHTKEITYFVMEFLEGVTLEKRVEQRGTLAGAAAAQLAIDLASGLRAGLMHGIIHRDVKPANVIVTPTGLAKIVDLGLATSASQSSDAHKQRVARVGTRGFMAPEIVSGGGGDFRSDMYSLGVTLYFALMATIPQETGTRFEFGSGNSPILADLVKQLLSVDPRLRPSSYEEIIERATAAKRESTNEV